MTDGDRLTKPMGPKEGPGGEDSGPKSPTIDRPEGGNELLRRLKKIDPDQAKKYRQRSGQ